MWAVRYNKVDEVDENFFPVQRRFRYLYTGVRYNGGTVPTMLSHR